jgi:argininosuccinate lyase
MMTTNLPSGYHRDLQLIKENFLPAFNDLNDCLNIAHYMFENIIIKTGIVEDDKYKYMFSVERVNELVLSGVPFRDAYKQVGAEIDANAFKANTNIQHSHEGSIGNLCNDNITKAMNEVLVSYNFATKHNAYESLLSK